MEGRQEAFMEREWESLDQKVPPIYYTRYFMYITCKVHLIVVY